MLNGLNRGTLVYL